MKISQIKADSYAMPAYRPAYSKPPFRFSQREYLIISYESDPDAIAAVVPEPLRPLAALVHYEFIRMPDSTGFGDYTESGQVIPVVDPEGRKATYTHSMYLDDEGPIAAGREIWGFPKKLAKPALRIDGNDTLLGTLDYGTQRIATGTMGYKYQTLDPLRETAALATTPNYLLKIIPHVDGTTRICELVRYYLRDVQIHGAWAGPGALDLLPHALAPVADLPVKRVLGAKHLLADLTLDVGEVAFDYLA